MKTLSYTKQLMLLAFSLGLLSSFAQVAADSMEVNTLKVKLHANGLLGEVKAGTTPILASGGLWLHGTDISGLNVSVQRDLVNRNDFSPGPISNDPNVATKYNKVYHVKLSTITNWVNSGGAVPQEIASWPAHGNTAMGEANYLAPFVDVNADGAYNPADGDYPDIKGDEALFAIFNDANARTNGTDLGVEIMLMVYGFSTGDVHDSIVYIEHTITKRTGTQLNACYLSLFTDFETGDIHASNVFNNSIFTYGPNATNPNYLTAGLRVIEGPKAEPLDGIDNDKDGCVDGIRQSNGNCLPEDPINNLVEHFLISGAMYFDENATVLNMGAPQTDDNYKNLMQYRWFNDSLLAIETPSGFLNTGNGDGYLTGNSSAATPYFFPGMSYDTTGNSAPISSSNWFQNPNQSNGMKTLTCAGPFTISGAGYSFSNIAAISWASGNANDYGYGKIDTLLGRLDDVYANTPIRYVSLGTHALPELSFKLFYDRYRNAWLVDNKEAKTLHFKLFSMGGSFLKSIEVAANSSVYVSLDGLSAGTYLLVNQESGKAGKISH